jgi:heme A synthase
MFVSEYLHVKNESPEKVCVCVCVCVCVWNVEKGVLGWYMVKSGLEENQNVPRVSQYR